MKNSFNYSRYLVIVYCMSVAFIDGDSIKIINKGRVKILADTEVNMRFDYINDGTYINDGVMHIHKNLINNGTIKFTDGETKAMVKFEGGDQQSIEGLGTSEYYNIQFNKTSGSISLKKEINIFGEIDFTKGIIQESSGGLVIFKNDATVIEVSDASFVDGKVRKIGNQDFTFPIGDEKGGKFIYRMAEISALNNATDVFEAEYFWQNSNSTHLHSSKEGNIKFINDVEYWRIDGPSEKSDVEVTLSWNSETTPQNIIEAADEGKLGIVRWNQNSKKWINEEGEVGVESNTITTTPRGFGIFTLAIIDKEFDKNGDRKNKTIPVSTAFTPNGDNFNDEFVIENLEILFPHFELVIVNRYGNTMYRYKHNGDPNKTPIWWNGSYNGKMNLVGGDRAPTGTYFYSIYFNAVKIKNQIGWIYLLR